MHEELPEFLKTNVRVGFCQLGGEFIKMPPSAERVGFFDGPSSIQRQAKALNSSSKGFW
jgi:hypothetical protein